MKEFFKKFKFELVLISPLLIFLLIFTLVPIVRTVILSFQQANTNAFTFSNYKQLISQPGFKKAFFNTVFIALVSLVLEMSLGLISALILSWKSKLIKIVRVIFILPLAIPTVVVGVCMSYLFATSGWINRILIDAAVIDLPIYWMEGGFKSLFMVVLADCWKVTPLIMLILLAGLESIDTDLYKAARIRLSDNP